MIFTRTCKSYLNLASLIQNRIQIVFSVMTEGHIRPLGGKGVSSESCGGLPEIRGTSMKRKEKKCT
jgi:hypothetical protein